MRRLNLGAGFDPTDGYVRVDRAGTPDVRCDVRHLPFQPGAFEEIKAHHILEHLPREALIPLVNSCWGLLGEAGRMEIEVPIFPSDAAMADPTHVSFFVSRTFDYFLKDGSQEVHRRLYGIKPWRLLRRERLGYNDILQVALERCPE